MAKKPTVQKSTSAFPRFMKHNHAPVIVALLNESSAVEVRSSDSEKSLCKYKNNPVFVQNVLTGGLYSQSNQEKFEKSIREVSKEFSLEEDASKKAEANPNPSDES